MLSYSFRFLEWEMIITEIPFSSFLIHTHIHTYIHLLSIYYMFFVILTNITFPMCFVF